MANTPKKVKSQVVKYNKWGYIFLIPFIVVYLIFQMVPLFTTIYNSFFENFLSGLKQNALRHITLPAPTAPPTREQQRARAITFAAVPLVFFGLEGWVEGVAVCTAGCTTA